MGMFTRSHFTPTRSGDYRLRLDDDERQLLRTLPDQLEGLLAQDGADAGAAGFGMVRLFPPAYLDERELDAEYHRLMRSELIQRRVEALGVVRETIDAERLTDEQLNAWMRVLNDVRLVLGTVLDVSEDTDPLDADPEDDDYGQRVVYVVLSGLVAEAVDALAGNLPPPTAPG